MKINLVRHARAISRSDWQGDDLLRPLSERGQSEAEALAEVLADQPIARIITGPTLRCQQTVEVLAVEKELPVEVDERLGRHEDVARVLELIPHTDVGPILFCTHSEIILPLLETLELSNVEKGAQVPCKKGSVWMLEGRGYTPTQATYLEPVRRAKRGRRVRYAEREIARARPIRAGVLDMGSTSFTLLIADVLPDGEIRPVVSEKVMLRLGAAITGDAVIPDAVFENAVEVARELHGVAAQEKVEHFHPVATAAVRDARNGREFAGAVSEAIDHPVRILSGEEEARVMFRAFQRRLDLGKRPVLGLDLGGGSLELAVGSARGVKNEVSLPLGVVRVRGELAPADPMRRSDVRRVREKVREELAPWRDELLGRKPVGAVAAGGTARALARLVSERGHDAPSTKALVLSSETLHSLARELSRVTHDERLAMRGSSRRRSDLMPTGAIILATLVEELGMEALTVCDWGLRQGILLGA